VHARSAKVGPKVERQVIARGTPGFSGAQMASLFNEAALMTARSD